MYNGVKNPGDWSFYPTWLWLILVPPAVHPGGLNFPSLHEGPCWSENTGHKVMLGCAVPLLTITSHWCYWLRCIHFSHHLSVCISSNVRTFIPAKISSFFFPRLLFLSNTTSSKSPSFKPQSLSCPNVNSLYAEAQHIIILLIVGSISGSFINWGI